MTAPRIICVLGMHRSGTSLTTRLLNLVGMHVGPLERLVRAASPNPKGFWEHRRLLGINNQILWRLGGHSHEPPGFPAGWEVSAGFDDLRIRARAVIEEDFSTADLWGWKDPRTCLTLPFWQSLLPSMSYVICMRHPMAVAQSLMHRDGLSLVESIRLWLVYLRSALTHTDGQDRILVFYDEIIEDWHAELNRLAKFVGRPDLASDPEVLSVAADFIDANLRHHRKDGRDVLSQDKTDPEVRLMAKVADVYQALEVARETFLQNEMGSALDDALEMCIAERDNVVQSRGNDTLS